MLTDLAQSLLKDKGFSFDVRNNGFHIIVENAIDFWPSTQKWRERTPHAETRKGIQQMMTLLELRRSKAISVTLSKEEVNLIVEDLIHIANHYEPDSPEEHELRKFIIKRLGGDPSLVEEG